MAPRNGRQPGRQDRRSLRQKAYEDIKRRILDSIYAPGALLSENQLAEEFRISRTPVREALRELATAGLVRILPQRGIVVTEMNLQDAIEVYQLRDQLECFATRLAAERMLPQDREGFERDHVNALKCLETGDLRRAYDHAVMMHRRIIAMARNSRLTQVMDMLADQTHRFGLLTLRHGRAETAILEHGDIIAAICAGDGVLAAARMRAHLSADRDMALSLILPAGALRHVVAPAGRAAEEALDTPLVGILYTTATQDGR